MTPLDGDEEGDLGSSTTHTPADSITSLSVNNLTPIMNALQSPSPPSMTVGPSLESDSTSRPRSGSLLRARSFPHQRVSSRDIGGGPESQPLEPAKVTQLRRWILTLAIVDFDLEVGPVISQTYPSVRMTAAERENIAFSSFPDSSLFETGSQCHSFRVRQSADTTSVISGDGFLYGYAYFLQKRDSASRRGYLQRSVVVLTQHAFPSLFIAVVSKLAPLYFAHGLTLIESACRNIAGWSDPTPGAVLELGFLGTVLNVELPSAEYQQQTTDTMSFGEKFNPKIHILASLPPLTSSPLTLFSPLLPKMWTLWECLVLSEPVLLFGTSPSQTSLAVWWLRDLLRPLPLTSDIRPYYHIHDRDFGQLINKNTPSSGLIVGVTNPFFENACKHWPHIASIGSAPLEMKSSKNTSLPSIAPVTGPTPGFHSHHSRFISKDKTLLKRLEQAVKTGGSAECEATTIFRRHFSTRNTQLIHPLNRYLTSLIQTTPTSTLRPFSQTDFLVSLKTHGSPLPFRSKGKEKDFYERWLKTPAFGLWLASRVDETTKALQHRTN